MFDSGEEEKHLQRETNLFINPMSQGKNWSEPIITPFASIKNFPFLIMDWLRTEKISLLSGRAEFSLLFPPQSSNRAEMHWCFLSGILSPRLQLRRTLEKRIQRLFVLNFPTNLILVPRSLLEASTIRFFTNIAPAIPLSIFFSPSLTNKLFCSAKKGQTLGVVVWKGDGSIWLVREKLNIKLWLSPQRPSPTLRKSMLARYLYNFSLLKTAEDSDAKPSLKSDKGRGKTNELW